MLPLLEMEETVYRLEVMGSMDGLTAAEFCLCEWKGLARALVGVPRYRTGTSVIKFKENERNTLRC